LHDCVTVGPLDEGMAALIVPYVEAHSFMDF